MKEKFISKLKKLICSILAVCLAVSLLPMAAFAAGAQQWQIRVQETGLPTGTKGTVTFTSGVSDYVVGEDTDDPYYVTLDTGVTEVQFTVTPPTDYDVESVQAGAATLTPTNDVYSFSATADTVINIAYTESGSKLTITGVTSNTTDVTAEFAGGVVTLSGELAAPESGTSTDVTLTVAYTDASGAAQTQDVTVTLTYVPAEGETPASWTLPTDAVTVVEGLTFTVSGTVTVKAAAVVVEVTPKTDADGTVTMEAEVPTDGENSITNQIAAEEAAPVTVEVTTKNEAGAPEATAAVNTAITLHENDVTALGGKTNTKALDVKVAAVGNISVPNRALKQILNGVTGAVTYKCERKAPTQSEGKTTKVSFSVGFYVGTNEQHYSGTYEIDLEFVTSFAQGDKVKVTSPSDAAGAAPRIVTVGTGGIVSFKTTHLSDFDIELTEDEPEQPGAMTAAITAKLDENLGAYVVSVTPDKDGYITFQMKDSSGKAITYFVNVPVKASEAFTFTAEGDIQIFVWGSTGKVTFNQYGAPTAEGLTRLLAQTAINQLPSAT